MDILPPEPPTALQSVTSPAKICSTCFLVSDFTGLPALTITAMPSYATIVGFILMPLAEAAPISDDLARRLDIPICAVPSMIAAIPVVEPSAAMSKVVPGCCALNCSANCGTSFAPRVSEPLMTRRSACALAMPATSSARLSARYFIFIYVLVLVFTFKVSVSPLHASVSLKDLILIKRIDGDIAYAPGAKRAIDAPRIGPCEVKAYGVGEHVPSFHGYGLLVYSAVDDVR